MITRAHERLPLPLLITGVAGVAGYNAYHYFRERYPGQVLAIRQEDNWPLTGDTVIPCNAEDRGRLQALFDEYQFRSVLNCAGNCALRACELDTRLAWRTNVEGLINLLSIIVERDGAAGASFNRLGVFGRPGRGISGDWGRERHGSLRIC